MAEEAENTEQTAPKKSKLKLIIIIVVALILLLVILFVVFKFVLAPKEPAEAADAQGQGTTQAAPVQTVPAAPAPATAPAPAMDMGGGFDMGGGSTEVGTIYPLPPFTLNLADPNGVTYLKIALSVEFDPKNKEIQAEVDAKMPKIQDMIITVLSSKALEEISTAQGKVNLRGELLRRINAMLAKGKLFNMYITEFVVQKA